MKVLIKFEWLKMLKKKKSVVIAGLIAALTILIMFFNMLMGSERDAGELHSLKAELQSLDESSARLPDDKNNAKLKKIRAHQEKERGLLEKRISSLQSDDWRQYLKSSNEYDALLMEGIRSGLLIGGEPLSDIEERMRLHTELLKRDIRPVPIDYHSEGYYNLKNTLGIFAGIAGIVIFLFLAGDVLSNELETPTGKFLFSQPVARSRIMHAKFIASFTGILAALGAAVVLSFTLGSLFNGTGSPDYPIAIVKNGAPQFIDLSSLLFSGIVLFLFAAAFALAVQYFFSVLAKNNTLALALTVIVIAVCYFGMTQYPFAGKIAHLVPFTYMDAFSIAGGTVAGKMDNAAISIQTGIAVLAVCTALLYAGTVRLLDGKDI